MNPIGSGGATSDDAADAQKDRTRTIYQKKLFAPTGNGGEPVGADAARR